MNEKCQMTHAVFLREKLIKMNLFQKRNLKNYPLNFIKGRFAKVKIHTDEINNEEEKKEREGKLHAKQIS
jgi:hypothetical protein